MKTLGYFNVIKDESFFQSWCNLAFFHQVLIQGDNLQQYTL